MESTNDPASKITPRDFGDENTVSAAVHEASEIGTAGRGDHVSLTKIVTTDTNSTGTVHQGSDSATRDHASPAANVIDSTTNSGSVKEASDAVTGYQSTSSENAITSSNTAQDTQRVCKTPKPRRVFKETTSFQMELVPDKHLKHIPTDIGKSG
jgi:hypothetical protein